MRFEICSSVHTYERRYSWMLSSIVQQMGVDLSTIRVCSAYIDGHPFPQPGCKEVVGFFREAYPDISWHDVPYPDATLFQRRGNVRNRHVQESIADWIIFADADMVFPPNFFRTLDATLSLDEFAQEDKCLHTGRYSTYLDETVALVDSDPGRYPCEIQQAWNAASQLPSVRKSNIGAGFCQIVRGDFIRRRGFYVPVGKAADWGWGKYSKCKSDHQFRRSVGRRSLPIPWLIHLQHQRDKDFGAHVELQR